MKFFFSLILFPSLVIPNEALLKKKNLDENRGERGKEINFGGKKKNSFYLYISII